ncbi:MAG: hemolysin family protein [Gemmatimonadaceae bacterium]
MNHVLAWVIGVLSAVLATAFATADAALLAVHTSEASTSTPVVFAERERMHRALAMARVVAYVAAGASLAAALHLAQASVGGRIFGIALVAAVICLFAEGTGRAVGYGDRDATFRRFGPMIRGVTAILRPAVALGGAIDRFVYAAIPKPASSETDRETSAEQFRDVIAAEADVSSAEEELIRGVFSLGDTEVKEIMVPRVDIIAVDVATPWSEVLDRIRSSEHARLPVFRETLDDVIGILYAKDALPAIVADEEPAESWGSLVRKPGFIPISKRIDTQLREFQASGTHIAIVIDEYGGTAGLVTIEDIIEEIVGEIRDEYDVEEPPIRQEGFRYWVSARVSIDELSERLDTTFPVEDVTTVGGLVYGLFGRVPKNGESLVQSGYRIVVERVRGRRIERLYFERLPTTPTPGGERE